MQHRPENLFLHVAYALDAENLRRNEAAAVWRFTPGDQLALGSEALAVLIDGFLRLIIDDGTDIRGNGPGIADGQSPHRALEHFKHFFLDILLDIEDPQR